MFVSLYDSDSGISAKRRTSEELVEINQSQAYSCTRKQLIEKLDAALKAAGETD
jgi:hypothetical protein